MPESKTQLCRIVSLHTVIYLKKLLKVEMGVKYSWKDACTCIPSHHIVHIMVIMLYTKQLKAGIRKIRSCLA